ncbi:hypothetical protein [Paracoccus marinaquae]|uniref:Uncharacterized protein n=1 Tax=Paracoccus marinaquae TaxID=2841926 RepID=A0ABS6AJ74_9RHOB|nr:hypothetical protein [Paracoccus marinaquae]MBU3030643.1 hypothetical protein [Paracoccus marinaquae]
MSDEGSGMKHSLLDEREQIETALDSAVGLAQAAILLLGSVDVHFVRMMC